MQCLKCSGGDTKVLDSRETSCNSVRRRRECILCGYRFSTLESPIKEGLYVVKEDGRREPFQEEKIRNSVSRAIKKRSVSEKQIEDLIQTVVYQVQQLNEVELPTKKIGELVMKELKAIDPVAYIRFTSVYEDFKSIKELHQALLSFEKEPLQTEKVSRD